MLLFNQQLSSSVGGERGHHRHSHMPQQQLHGYLTEDKLPWLLASLALEPSTLKYMTRKGIYFFPILSSLNAFFNSSFNNNFTISEERRNHIKFLQMLICNRRKKIKEDTKKKKAEQTSLTTQQARQLAAVSEKDTHFVHAKTTQWPPLLPPPSPARSGFPNENPTVCVPYTTGLWDYIQALLIFTPT